MYVCVCVCVCLYKFCELPVLQSAGNNRASKDIDTCPALLPLCTVTKGVTMNVEILFLD